MNKKFLNTIPYILGLTHLIYCLFNVDSWVKSHTEEYLFFVALAWAIAVITAIILFVLNLTKKQKYKFYLPTFFFVVGAVVYIVALSIPCCTGG